MLEITLPLILSLLRASLIHSGRMAPVYPFSRMIVLADCVVVKSDEHLD